MGKESWDGHATSEDLLCEHDADIDLALKTSLVMPVETQEKAEAEGLTEGFDDNETADKAAVGGKADPDDERNTG